MIALTDGKLWALDRRVFKKVVLKPKDMRKDTIRALRRVDMFKCLNLQQLQRLTDLLVESSYSAGDVIVQKGVPLSAFYIIMTGYCALLREDQKLGDPDVTKLIDLDCFGEKSLFDTVEADVSLVAGNDVKVLAITRVAFEEALGPMEKLQAEARIKKNLVVKTEINAPNSLSEVHLQGLVGVDVLGPIMLGTFSGLTPNLSVRSFVLADVEEKGIHQSVKQYIDAVEIVSANLSNNFINALIPRHISILRSPNALHLVFACPIVADLSGLIRTRGDDFDISNDVIVYIVSCIASALETLHGMNIIYRAVQPESLCVDSSGRVVLIDYRVCKLGVVGYSAKTYTICGAADYLAPEQIAQTGHSYPVDLWCLGVLMYELLVGSHPFSSSSEVATFSKISSFGSKTFQTLKFPENISADAKSLINQLLMPVPEARVGAGPNGFSNLKKHAFFKTGMDWDLISAGSSLSPLMGIAEEEMNDITKDGIDQEILSNFDVPYTGSDWHDGLEF